MPSAPRALFHRLIDDAALFPPGNAPMADAVPAHAGHKAGPNGWMLGRFLCPPSRLDELRAALGPAQTIEVGAVLGAGWDDDAAAVAGALDDDRLRLTAVEARLPDATTAAVDTLVAALAAVGLGPTVAVYAEPPDSTDASVVAASVRAAGRARRPVGAKLRCGGTSPGAVPGADVVATFFEEAAACGVPAKATAGLHHPFPTYDPVTGDTMHGFVNVVAAAALAGTVDDLTAVLGDGGDAFALGEDGLRWRDRVIDADALATTRARRFHGFGSCSFTEPIGDLTAAGMLVTVP